MRRIKVLFLLYALLVSGCGAGEELDLSTSNLFKWSNSNQDHTKKIVFIHGRFTVENESSLGHSHEQIETMFASKLTDINYACGEIYDFNLVDKVEVWLYTYNTHREISDIVADLANDMESLGWDGSMVCVIGYSQGGVVTWELDRQYPNSLVGAITLGSPVDGTPLVSPFLVDEVARNVMPSFPEGLLWEAACWLTQGADNIVESREERETNNPFLMIAGTIEAKDPSYYVAETILGGLEDILESGEVSPGDRNHAQLGATIIANAMWHEETEFNRISDGLVPVSSATYCATVTLIMPNYDHFELLSGKDDMILPRHEFEWIDRILNLSEEPEGPEFSGGDNIPELPVIDIIIFNPLNDARYAYILDDAVWVATDDWQSQKISDSDVSCSFPRFDRSGERLTWTAETEDQSFVCMLGNSLTWLSGDTDKSMASFSPNGEWLVYQSDDKLVIYNLESQEEFVVIASGVDLTAPPCWVTNNFLSGRIYFANQNSGVSNLYWISPRTRDGSIADAEMIIRDCGKPLWVGGNISGIVAIANERSSGVVQKQEVSVIADVIGVPITVKLDYGETSETMFADLSGISLEVSRYYGFESAAIELSGQSAVAYLVNSDGIYILDGGMLISESNPPSFDEVFYLLIEGGCNLDINPAL
ncbi:MAG: hypothetical protein U9M89_02380 [Patescibacteria group bacterium]|nr:hypothetical protein [Patescibacteria group bacterium]